MDRQQFESLVTKAAHELPEEFVEHLNNVAILIEDYPSDELLAQMGLSEHETLFGLYQGVPLTERGHFNAPLFPDRILIFQGPIEDACDSPEEIREQVRITLLHEIGHFFGFDEDELEERGYH